MKMERHIRLKRFLKNPIAWLGTIGALLYSSWPLGYVLNPNVAHGALASQLEASGQPYNWVFIGLDVLTGVILLGLGLLQWSRATNFSAKLSIVSYMVFGVLVITAALIPFNCNNGVGSCSDIAHSPLLFIHGLASIASPVALLVSLALLVKSVPIWRTTQECKLICLSVMSAWGLVGILALKNYHQASENLVQHLFISICSLSLLIVIVLIERLSFLQSSQTQ